MQRPKITNTKREGNISLITLSTILDQLNHPLLFSFTVSRCGEQNLNKDEMKDIHHYKEKVCLAHQSIVVAQCISIYRRNTIKYNYNSKRLYVRRKLEFFLVMEWK